MGLRPETANDAEYELEDTGSPASQVRWLNFSYEVHPSQAIFNSQALSCNVFVSWSQGFCLFGVFFWNTVVSCFAEGLLGSTHQHNTCEWWKKQKWSEWEAESQCNCDRGPGQSYREFWSWNGPLECSQLGLWGQAFVPTLRTAIGCKLLTLRSQSFDQGYFYQLQTISGDEHSCEQPGKWVPWSERGSGRCIAASPLYTGGSPSIESSFFIRMWPCESAPGLESPYSEKESIRSSQVMCIVTESRGLNIAFLHISLSHPHIFHYYPFQWL